MLARESRRFFRLHEAARRLCIGIRRRAHTHVPRALLHDNTENNALLNANLLRSRDDGIPDAADVFAGVASLQHLGLVDVEDLLERLPGVHGWELGGRTGVGCEAHNGWLRADVCVV